MERVTSASGEASPAFRTRDCPYKLGARRIIPVLSPIPMVETIDNDVVIVGSGLAGLRAAVEVLSKSKGVGKEPRCHLEAGADAQPLCVRRGRDGRGPLPRGGDSLELHAWDTVKGSDFLADQDTVWKFVNMCPEEIRQMERWGIPWSRKDDGRIAQRPFGGHTLQPGHLCPGQGRLLRDEDALRQAAGARQLVQV